MIPRAELGQVIRIRDSRPAQRIAIENYTLVHRMPRCKSDTLSKSYK